METEQGRIKGQSQNDKMAGERGPRIVTIHTPGNIDYTQKSNKGHEPQYQIENEYDKAKERKRDCAGHSSH